MPTRQSNLELLRIVSMLMVLAVHIDGASLGLPQLFGDFDAAAPRDFWRLGVESVTIVGVNCFTLISGYFGIRLRLRSAAAYLFQCLFYSVGVLTVYAAFNPGSVSLTQWLESWLVLTHSDLWYVPAYFGLMLLSPFLNAGIRTLPRRTFSILLAVFVVYNLWAGWWWEGRFNPTGYTLVQLLMVYLLGAAASMWLPSLRSRFNHLSLISAAFYCLFTAVTFLLSLYMPAVKAFAYNSPFVLGASLALFVCFAGMNFSSRPVNFIAKSAFAAYLVHKAPVVWVHLMKPHVIGMWGQLSLPLFTLWAVGLMLAIYAAVIPLDSLRRFLQNRIFGIVSDFLHQLHPRRD